MNNFERIKNMDINEMAEFIAHAECFNTCVYGKEGTECNKTYCVKGVKQ